MPKLPDDQWPAGDPALASFAEDLRIIAGGPAPEPRPGLVAVMRQGPTVPSGPPAGRKRMLVKTVVGGLVAKVALGMGVAAASVTAAGAAGVLPDPAQHALASVVAATTPFVLPDPSNVNLQVTGPSSSTTSTALAGDDDDDDDEAGDRKVNHGACVSAAARDKEEPASGSHGKTVSSIARSDCGKTESTPNTSTSVLSSTTSTSVTSSTTSTSVAGPQGTANSGSGSANSGRGNGANNGNGNGNSGNGNGGNGGNGNPGKN